MNWAFSSGKVSMANMAQCPQVIDTYSMIVTGAVGEPNTWSGKGPGSARSRPLTVWARAAGEKPRPPATNTAPDSTAGAARLTKARRLTFAPDASENQAGDDCGVGRAVAGR